MQPSTMANSTTATTRYNSFNSEDSLSAKAVPLYHHEQVPFINRQRSHSQQEQQSIQLSSSSPIAREQQGTHQLQQQYQPQQGFTHESQQQQQQQQSSVSGDLQDIIYSYQAQPELLKLILLSKLEEDKRRAEEAKLRAKELDLLLIQQQQQEHQQQQYQHTTGAFSFNNESPTTPTVTDAATTTTSHPQPNDPMNTHFMQPTPPLSSSSSTDGRSIFQPRPSLDALLSNATTTNHSSSVGYLPQQQQQQQTLLRREESVLCSSFNESVVPDNLDEHTFSPMTSTTVTTNTTTAAQTPVSATPTFMSLNSYPASSELAHGNTTMMIHQYHQQSNKHIANNNSQYPSSVYQQQPQQASSSFDNSNTSSASIPAPIKYDLLPTMPPSSTADLTKPYTTLRPRRRREMQAITKIVETREYPYNDGYFWKNNGNTVQKKTGNKSVYYKCSNSTKGCPVNKTVTWKENGEFLIKYRGEHLPDCNKVQRIIDI